jgi:uncharacterized membrane protein YraQ (UPF0718 family)
MISVEDHIKNFIIIFTSILYEAMPFIVLGAVIAGMLEELVPQKLVARIIPKSRILAIAIGGLLGLLFPMCECGIIPVMRRLLRKGVPLSCCVCYMLAGPIINVVVMLSTYVAFWGMENVTDASGRPTYQIGGLGMMSLRMGLGYLVAFGTSLIVEWQYRKHGNKLLAPLAVPGVADTSAENGDDEGEKVRRSFLTRLSNISETALHDFVDITVFLILGALLAALSRQLFPHEVVENWSRTMPVLSILAMMGLAILLCLCSEADAFVAASFVSLRPASKLAFLVLGPMLDFKLYMMYTRVFRPRLIWTIIISVAVQVFIYSVLTHFIWETFGPSWVSASTAASASP